MICKKHQPKECEDCIREEINKLENKIKELKSKLPREANLTIYPQSVMPLAPYIPNLGNNYVICN